MYPVAVNCSKYLFLCLKSRIDIITVKVLNDFFSYGYGILWLCGISDVVSVMFGDVLLFPMGIVAQCILKLNISAILHNRTLKHRIIALRHVMGSDFEQVLSNSKYR